MADQQFKQQPTIFTFKKLQMKGVPWEKNDWKKIPGLIYKVVNLNPRFQVYMNDGNVEKPLNFAMNPLIANQFFVVMRDIISRPTPDRVEFEIKGTFDHRGQQTDKPAPISRMFVGRNNDGVMYMSFQAKNESPAMFLFQSDFFAEMKGPDGERLEVGRASNYAAEGYLNLMTQLTNTDLVVNYKEPPAPQSKGGGNYGGGNGGGGNSAGGNGGGGNNWNTQSDY